MTHCLLLFMKLAVFVQIRGIQFGTHELIVKAEHLGTGTLFVPETRRVYFELEHAEMLFSSRVVLSQIGYHSALYVLHIYIHRLRLFDTTDNVDCKLCDAFEQL